MKKILSFLTLIAITSLISTSCNKSKVHHQKPLNPTNNQNADLQFQPMTKKDKAVIKRMGDIAEYININDNGTYKSTYKCYKHEGVFSEDERAFFVEKEMSLYELRIEEKRDGFFTEKKYVSGRYFKFRNHDEKFDKITHTYDLVDGRLMVENDRGRLFVSSDFVEAKNSGNRSANLASDGNKSNILIAAPEGMYDCYIKNLDGTSSYDQSFKEVISISNKSTKLGTPVKYVLDPKSNKWEQYFQIVNPVDASGSFVLLGKDQNQIAGIRLYYMAPRENHYKILEENVDNRQFYYNDAICKVIDNKIVEIRKLEATGSKRTP